MFIALLYHEMYRRLSVYLTTLLSSCSGPPKPRLCSIGTGLWIIADEHCTCNGKLILIFIILQYVYVYNYYNV